MAAQWTWVHSLGLIETYLILVFDNG